MATIKIKKERLEEKIDLLVSDMSEIKRIFNENLQLKEKVDNLESKVNFLEQKINKLEQNKLNKNIDIVGFPIKSESNIKKDITKLFSDVTNVNFNEADLKLLVVS